jgi:hypothetical protein
MTRVLFAMSAPRVAQLRHEIGASRVGVGQLPVLIREVEIVIANQRLGHEQVVRLIAVDRCPKLQRDHHCVTDCRNHKGPIAAPFHVLSEGDEP